MTENEVLVSVLEFCKYREGELIKAPGRNLFRDYSILANKDDRDKKALNLLARRMLKFKLDRQPDFLCCLPPGLMKKMGYRIRENCKPRKKEIDLIKTLGLDKSSLVVIIPGKRKFEAKIIERGANFKLIEVMEFETFNIYYTLKYMSKTYRRSCIDEARALKKKFDGMLAELKANKKAVA